MNTKLEYKVLFHIDQDDEDLLVIAIKNALNLIADKGVSSVRIAVRIAFVANYVAPKLFIKDVLGEETAENLANLAENKNVSVFICNNSLRNLNIDKTELLDFCEVVPAGIVKIVELQNRGFAYVKP